MIRSEWDGVTLPYRPKYPVMLGWRNPVSRALRICVPDHTGAYHQLVQGVQYFELPWAVTPVEELPDGPRAQSAGTQVVWADLPVPPESHLAHFLPPQVGSSSRR